MPCLMHYLKVLKFVLGVLQATARSIRKAKNIPDPGIDVLTILMTAAMKDIKKRVPTKEKKGSTSLQKNTSHLKVNQSPRKGETSF